MKTQLVKYEAAITAIAAARSVDEVKDCRSIAMAMKLYAMQANDRRMEADALEIRMRAALRLGEMIEAQKETVGLAKRGKSRNKNVEICGISNIPQIKEPQSKATLAEAGIDKNLAIEARTAVRLQKENKFEDKIKEERAKIINRANKRKNNPILDDMDILALAKKAVKLALEANAKLDSSKTSFTSLRENCLAAGNAWIQLASRCIVSSTDLREVK